MHISFFTQVEDPQFQGSNFALGKFGEWLVGGKTYKITRERNTSLLAPDKTSPHSSWSWKRIACTVTILPLVLALIDKAIYRYKHYDELCFATSESSTKKIIDQAKEVSVHSSLHDYARVVSGKMDTLSSSKEKEELAYALAHCIDKEGEEWQKRHPIISKISAKVREGLGGILPKTAPGPDQAVLNEWALMSLSEDEIEDVLKHPFRCPGPILRAVLETEASWSADLETSDETTIKKYAMAKWVDKIQRGLSFLTEFYWSSLDDTKKRDIIVDAISSTGSESIGKKVIENAFKTDGKLPETKKETWLIHAISRNKHEFSRSAFEIVKILIAHGHDVNECTRLDEETPLHKVIQNNTSSELLEFLLQNGADPTLVNNKSETSFQVLLSLFSKCGEDPAAMPAMTNAIIQTSSLLKKHLKNIQSAKDLVEKIEAIKNNPAPLFEGIEGEWDGKSREHPLYLVLLTRDEDLLKAFQNGNFITGAEAVLTKNVLEKKGTFPPIEQ